MGNNMTAIRAAALLAAATAVATASACTSAGSNTASVATASSTSSAVTPPAASTPTTDATTPTTATSVSSTPAATPSSPAAQAPDSQKVVVAAWLPASQFPLIGKMPWKTSPYGTGGVATNSGADEQTPAYLCQASHLANAGVKGIQAMDYHLDPEPSPNSTQVQQLQLFFTDPAAAKVGLTTIDGWHTTCPYGPSHKTATIPGGAAYVVGQDGADGQITHEYFVQRGSVIDSIVITGYNEAAAKVKDASQDKATLDAIASRLCAYSGAC
jgi:hypothetical protein